MDNSGFASHKRWGLRIWLKKQHYLSCEAWAAPHDIPVKFYKSLSDNIQTERVHSKYQLKISTHFVFFLIKKLDFEITFFCYLLSFYAILYANVDGLYISMEEISITRIFFFHYCLKFSTYRYLFVVILEFIHLNIKHTVCPSYTDNIE